MNKDNTMIMAFALLAYVTLKPFIALCCTIYIILFGGL